jgi:hypothetical protein
VKNNKKVVALDSDKLDALRRRRWKERRCVRCGAPGEWRETGPDGRIVRATLLCSRHHEIENDARRARDAAERAKASRLGTIRIWCDGLIIKGGRP